MHYEKTVFVDEFNIQHNAVTSACKFSVKCKRYVKFGTHTNIHLLVGTAAYLFKQKIIHNRHITKK
jgi:hypothetical protein